MAATSIITTTTAITGPTIAATGGLLSSALLNSSAAENISNISMYICNPPSSVLYLGRQIVQIQIRRNVASDQCYHVYLRSVLIKI